MKLPLTFQHCFNHYNPNESKQPTSQLQELTGEGVHVLTRHRMLTYSIPALKCKQEENACSAFFK